MAIKTRKYIKTKIGDKINNWTIISKSKSQNIYGRYKWVVECICGERKEKVTSEIKAANSCGCIVSNIVIGQKFGKLKVLGFAYKKRNQKWWNLKCDCGNKHVASTNSLNTKSIKSCGCSKINTYKEGTQVGKLKIVKLSDYNNPKRKARYWECLCSCGNKTNKSSSDIERAIEKNINISCGCNFELLNIGDKFSKLTVIEILEERNSSGQVLYLCKCECGNNCKRTISALRRRPGSPKSCGCSHYDSHKKLKKPRITVESKKCPKCKIKKSASEFGKAKERPDGLKALCNKCVYATKDKAKVIVNIQIREERTKNATPPWVKKSDLEKIHRKRIELQKKLSKKLHVDHILPLLHKKYCGLNVPWNLQITSRDFNLRKATKVDTVKYGIGNKNEKIKIHKSVYED